MWSWRLLVYPCSLFGIFYLIIPKNASITLKLATLNPHTISELERDIFGYKIWTWRLWSTFFISIHDMGALNHFPKLTSFPKYIQGSMNTSWNDLDMDLRLEIVHIIGAVSFVLLFQPIVLKSSIPQPNIGKCKMTFP